MPMPTAAPVERGGSSSSWVVLKAIAQARLRIAVVRRRVSVGLVARPEVMGGGVAASLREEKHAVWEAIVRVNLK